MKLISSKDNSLIKKIKSLSVKKYREQFGLFLVEGEKVCKEYINNYPSLVDCIIIKQGYEDNFNICYSNFNSYLVVAEIFKTIVSTINCQHIACLIKTKPMQSTFTKNNLLVLDRLQDPGNMGTIIRSAVASGFTDIVLINSVDPYNPKTIRSTSGNINKVNFYTYTEEELLKNLNSQNYKIIVAEANAQSVFNNIKLPIKYALVIGNEGKGVSETIKNNKYMSLSIPMQNNVESLNAGVSASILMFLLNK